MQRRPPHKAAHTPCPRGATNWAECDLAGERQWGRCQTMVGKYEPEPCTRWATGEEGWCSQHLNALLDAEKKRERDAEYQLQLVKRIDAHIAWTHLHPSVWDLPSKATGRKGPHRLTALS